MYFIYLLISVIAITTVTCNDDESFEVFLYDLEEAEFHFNAFIAKFDKNYVGSEREYRLSVFKTNLKKINDINAEANRKLYGITQFADMTEAEFTNFANCFHTDDRNTANVNVINSDSSPDKDYPASLDYRDSNLVSEVKNQASCNSCYIFSAVENIEGQYARVHRTLVSLSEQEVLDCMTPGGCFPGGMPSDVMQKVADFGGLVAEDTYPYRGQQNQCTVDKNQIVARVTGGQPITAGEASLIQQLNDNGGPLSISMYVSPNLQNLNSDYIFNDPTCSTQSIGAHAVLLVGYGTDTDGAFWLIKNSWGTSWGNAGYFRMARGVGMCGIGQLEVATATVT